MLPNTLFNLYSSLSDKNKQEVKRTTAGVGSQVIREGIELYRMFDKPTEEELQSTEQFLENLYEKTVGEENVTRVQRGDREVVTIAEPESSAGKIARDIGSFTATMVGAGKITKPLQFVKSFQKVKAVAPKTTSALGFTARGEVATQLSINPYEENLANIIGSMIDDDSEGWASDLENYLLDPIKSDKDKTELENRLGLLSTGLALTGAFGTVVGGITNRKEIATQLSNSFKNIKDKGGDASKAFVDTIKRYRNQDKDFRLEAKELRTGTSKTGQREIFESDVGDIAALNEGGLRKFSSVPLIRSVSNALAKTFTTRGGRSKLLHQNYLKTQNLNERWDATIDHVGRNLQKSIDDIHKSVGGNKENVIENINKILFTDFRVPTIVTTKKTRVGQTQSQALEKELKKLPKETREPIRKARDLQDKLSKLLLQSESVSVADKEIIKEQLGFYVRESYRIYEDMGYTASLKATREARQFIKEDIQRRNPNLTNRQLRLKLESEMEQLAGGKGQYTSFSSGFESFNKIRSGILVEKQTIPPAIKAYMGEINDPVEKLLISMKKISSFIEDSKFHSQAYKDGKDIYFHSSKTTIPGFDVQIPIIPNAKVQPYGELSGKFTSKELASYYTNRYQQGLILDSDSSNVFATLGKDIWRSLLFLKSQSQKSKTVRRVGTHIKNIFGGAQITGANGFSMFSGKGLSQSMKTIKDQLIKTNNVEAQKFIEKLSGYGILNKNAVINDLKNLATEASQVKYNPFSKPAAYLKNTKAGKLLLKVDEKATDLYIAEDDLWKINMWIKEQDHLNAFNNSLPKNSTFKILDVEQEAARLTRNGLPNYDLVPENIQKLRGVPLVGKFFSFLSESMRLSVTIPRQGFKELQLSRQLAKEGLGNASSIMSKRGVDRLSGYSVFAIGGGAAATGVANYANGVAQETIDNLKPFLPKWMQNDNVVYSVNEEGVPIVYNVTPWDAFDFPRKPFQTALHIGMNNDLTEQQEKQFVNDLFVEMVTPFFGESLSQEVISNYVFRGGRDVNNKLIKNPYNPLERFDDTGDTWWENITNGDNLKLLGMNLVEAVEPGTLTDVRRYAKTWDKEVTELDQAIYPKQAMVKLLTGFGGMPMNEKFVENLYSIKINNFRQKRSKRISDIYLGIKDNITPPQFIEHVNKINRKYYDDFAEIHNLTENAENLNINTLSILDDNGISRSDRITFTGNTRYFNPLKITDNMKLRILESKQLKNNYFDLLMEIDRQNRILSQLPILQNLDTDTKVMKEDEVDNIFKGVRMPKSTGGLIEGDFKVPYTKEDPADRRDPNTGLPYSDQMEDLLG